MIYKPNVKKLWVLLASLVLLPLLADAMPFVPLTRFEADHHLDARTKKTIEQVVSAFENETPIIQYAYIEHLDDGRGFTAGRAGFTTGTGDLLLVVERYEGKYHRGIFRNLMSNLSVAAENHSSQTVGLETLPVKWREAANDPDFRRVQDEVSDELYFAPALVRAESLGLTSALGLLVIYDTFIQHGSYGFENLARQMNPNLHSEKEKLLDFLKIRRQELMNPSERGTADVWRESVGRVDALEKLIQEEAFALPLPFTIAPFGAPVTIQ